VADLDVVLFDRDVRVFRDRLPGRGSGLPEKEGRGGEGEKEGTTLRSPGSWPVRLFLLMPLEIDPLAGWGKEGEKMAARSGG